MRSNASKQVIPRRVATFTSSVNEISREFTEHLAGLAQRGGGEIDDVLEEVTKFAFQGEQIAPLLLNISHDNCTRSFGQSHPPSGVAFFVFGEKLKVYEDDNPDYKEMSDASRAFIGSLTAIAVAPPLYKIFPTKVYRHYLDSVKRVHSIGKRIMEERHTELKVAMETGTVDESRATGKAVSYGLA